MAPKGPYHTETINFIYILNRLTGFYIPIRTLILQLKKEIASKQCTGFVIYEDLSICRMEDTENLIFNIFC